jgi:cell division protein FtsW
MSLSRADKSGFTAWWWTIDRVVLFAVLALIAIGLILAFAASPAATGGHASAGDFRYAGRQVAFAAVAVVILGVSSLLSLRAVKLTAAVVFALALIGAVLAILTGSEVLGARRWIDLGWMTLQPSEFLKPGLAVLGSAILADRAPMIMPKPVITLLLAGPAIVVLLLQPDVGQSGLLLALWGVLLFFYGVSPYWMGALAGCGAGLGVFAYYFFPHVQHRVLQFLGGDKGAFQTGLSLKAFAHGGLWGVGPGAGTVKYRLPDVHSDFIFAVAGEEFGLLLCGLIAALFCVLSVRLLTRSAQARDPFAQMAGAALAVVLALQAFINMGVAVSLLPAKGMTLPFISYGGSSLFAVALTMGFALAVTRQRPKIGARDHHVFGFLREARA